MLNEPPTSTDETVGAMLDEMEIGDGRVGLVMFLTRASPGDQGTWGKRGLEIIPMGIAFSPTEEGATYRFTAIHQNTGGGGGVERGSALFPVFVAGNVGIGGDVDAGSPPRSRAAHVSLVRDVSANTGCRGAITLLPLAFSLRRFVTWP